MCHRKNILDDMQSISEQMTINRRQGTTEVISFIDKQAKDAHDQAKKLVDDAIDRIIKASKNIYTYIENRRQAKLARLDECLEKFDKDAELLNSKIKNEIFLSADMMLDLRRKYAYNMFDQITANVEHQPTDVQRQNEVFFNDYRFYNELINLRQKWTFLQAALTTVYYPAKKDISLDKILTFLEYRHDRVLENYRDFLSAREDCKDLSLKPAEELIHDLSFLSKTKILPESENFSFINDLLTEVHIDEPVNVKEHEMTPKTDSGHGDDDDDDDDETTSNWQIEDGLDEYDVRFMKLSQSMQQLEKQFENDLRPFLNSNFK